MKRNSIIMGTLILSASSIFVRMIGFVFRVWLSNTMGAEAIGVYMLIMSLYNVCATLATSGISGGVSKLAAAEFGAGKEANAKRILRRALTLSITLSTAVGVALFLFAEPIAAHLLRDARTTLSLRLLAPGLPMMSVSSCLRGYFIAKRKVINPACSQVFEQLVKMAFIMAVIGLWIPRGIEYACAVVILGITIGECVCLSVSVLGYLADKRRYTKRQRADIKGVTKSLLAFAIPVSVGSYVRSGLRLVEDVLIISGLRAFSGREDAATGTYGMLRGMAMPLLTFPLSLLSAFVVTLTPEISRMNELQNKERLERTISRILQFTSMIGIFIVCVFMSFSHELGMLIYKDPQVGEMLSALSWLCPFMCVEMVVVSILQGLGEQVSSLRYNVTDCLLRVAMVYVLVPRWGVTGFLWMVVVSNLYTSVLNLRRLVKITGISLRLGEWVMKPVLAAMATSQLFRMLCNLYLFQSLPMWAVLVFGSAVSGICYLLILFSVGSLTAGDFQWVLGRLKLPGKSLPVAPEKSY